MAKKVARKSRRTKQAKKVASKKDTDKTDKTTSAPSAKAAARASRARAANRHRRQASQSSGVWDKVKFILMILLGIILIFNIITISSLKSEIKEKIQEAKEMARPAEIEIITITNTECNGCFDVTAAVDAIKKNSKNNVTNEISIEFGDAESNKYISTYGIEKIPTVIVIGETDKASIKGLEQEGKAYVLRNVEAPFTDAGTGNLEGLVDVVSISAGDCEHCVDLTPSLHGLISQGVFINERTDLTPDMPDAKALLAKHEIKRLPAIVLSEDINLYTKLFESLARIGTASPDGSFVIRSLRPPYLDVDTGDVTGIVNLLLIGDESCEGCYDVNTHKRILAQFGVRVADERYIDYTDAMDTIEKYNITQIPTIVMSKGAGDYQALTNVWQQVGSIEDDGVFIFRKVEVMNAAYRDLESGEIMGNPVVAAAPEGQAAEH